MQALSFDDPDPQSLSHAMARFIGMFDLVRDGAVNAAAGEVPDDPRERANHLKAAGYYFDASMMGVWRAAGRGAAGRADPQPDGGGARRGTERRASPTSFAAGMDMILADVMESARTVHGPIDAPHARDR